MLSILSKTVDYVEYNWDVLLTVSNLIQVRVDVNKSIRNKGRR